LAQGLLNARANWKFRAISWENVLILMAWLEIQSLKKRRRGVKLVQKNTRPLEWAGIESPEIRIWHATKFGSHNEIRSVRWRWFRCQESLAAQLNATVLIDIDHLHLD